MLEPVFDVQATLRRFAPEVRLHPDDPHRPSSVSWYLDRTRLRRRRGLFQRDVDVIADGRLNPESLARASSVDLGDPTNLYLDILSGSNRRNTRRGFRPVAGLLSAPCYVNARSVEVRASAVFDLQYWFFYPYNGSEGRHVTHQGDWEHITVRVTNTGEPQLVSAYVSAHGLNNGGWALPGDYRSSLRVNSTGNPIIYSALGSHASYTSPGIHKQTWPKAGDRTVDGGPIWNTGDDLVLVEMNGQRPTQDEKSHQWLEFQGTWGVVRRFAWPFASTGPIGPSHQSSWTGEPDQRKR
jgi:hypothetical protein